MSEGTEKKQAEGQEENEYLTGKDGANGPARSEGEDKATKTASSQGASNESQDNSSEEKQAS